VDQARFLDPGAGKLVVSRDGEPYRLPVAEILDHRRQLGGFRRRYCSRGVRPSVVILVLPAEDQTEPFAGLGELLVRRQERANVDSTLERFDPALRGLGIPAVPT